MIKRAALARALALDPDVLFLDEPTSGLDPIGAGEFDELIATLQTTLGLTVFMVTHDLDSLYAICDRVAVLVAGKVGAIGTIERPARRDRPLDSRIFPWQARREPRSRLPLAGEMTKIATGIGKRAAGRLESNGVRI